MNPEMENEQLVEGVRRLQSGEVIAIPTDTYYGLAADVLQPAAVAQINPLKDKPQDAPILMLAADLKQVLKFTRPSNQELFDRLSSLWPGPLTLIISANPVLPEPVRVDGTVAVRVPDADIPRQLASRLGQPITAPSANPHGMPPPTTAAEVRSGFGGDGPWVLDGGPTAGKAASTMVQITENEPKIVREGAISREMLEQCLGRSIL